jgi:hypothetical protein
LKNISIEKNKDVNCPCMKLSTIYITDNVFCSQNVAPAIFGEDGECCAGAYRYGFNTQEKEDEISVSAGTHYSAEFWMYDTRIGRRWNLDPKPNPSLSHHSTFAGNPIMYTDFLGDTISIRYREKGRLFRSEHIYEPGEKYTGNSDFVIQTIEALEYLRPHDLPDGVFRQDKGIIQTLSESTEKVVITKGKSPYFNDVIIRLDGVQNI